MGEHSLHSCDACNSLLNIMRVHEMDSVVHSERMRREGADFSYAMYVESRSRPVESNDVGHVMII